eukprot:TRINITY_DN18591_c0_g1_i1.p1 TRINITY_DN18591_c0_g1~~TRINITY_DN18591_c0_g1_i1.p1  ORF type:complete len:245 (+),score=52.38 TRINITY_DN18591_c0_g1_i1:107-841(+)
MCIRDRSSFKSIRAFAAKFTAEHPKLHSAVLNAGVMACPFSLTADGLEMQIGTNHFGHFLLTELLMSGLEAAAAESAATVVVLSSSAHYRSYPDGIKESLAAMNDPASYNEQHAYGQSKLANVLFAQELALRVRSKGILVNSVHPGGVNTELGRHLQERIQPVLGDRAVGFLREAVVPAVLWDPKDAALTQVYAAVGPKLIAQKSTGLYFHPIARPNPNPHAHTRNETLQKHLWKLTEDFIKAH